MVADGKEAELILYHVAAVLPRHQQASPQRREGAGGRTGGCICQLLCWPEAQNYGSVAV